MRSHDEPVIVTVAPTGGFLTPDQHPFVPVQPDEIATDVARCASEGASMAALHARRPDGQATCDPQVYRAINDLVRERCDVVVNNSTGGGLNGDLLRVREDGGRFVDWDARLAGIDGGADTCTLDPVTAYVSVPDGEILVDTPTKAAEQLTRAMAERAVKPEWEAFGPSHLVGEIPRLLGLGLHSAPHLINLVLGQHRAFQNAMPYTPEILQFMVGLLPDDAVFTATICGDEPMHGLTQALLLGGHVRVGIEDHPGLVAGVPSENARLVSHVVGIIESLGLQVASADEARSILGLAATEVAHAPA